MKHRGLTKVANAFELEQDKELAKKIDPTAGHKQQFELSSNKYTGAHLFILVHGLQGTSFDMRTMKNIIAVALPDALFLQSISNE